jgi:hypothetical protein
MVRWYQPILLVKIPMPEIVGWPGAEDGGAFPPGVLLEERIPSEEDVANAAPFGIEMFGPKNQGIYTAFL